MSPDGEAGKAAALRALSERMTALIRASVVSDDFLKLKRAALRRLLLNLLDACEQRIRAERLDAARQSAGHIALAFQAIHKEEVARLQADFQGRLAALSDQLEALKSEIHGPEPEATPQPAAKPALRLVPAAEEAGEPG